MDALPFETPEFSALLDDAEVWLELAKFSSMALGLTLAQGIEAMLPRLHTGYMPKSQRKTVAHGLYSMGARRPPARHTAATKARAEAVAWGLAS